MGHEANLEQYWTTPICLHISEASCSLEKARKHSNVFVTVLQYLKVNVMVTQASSLWTQRGNCTATARQNLIYFSSTKIKKSFLLQYLLMKLDGVACLEKQGLRRRSMWWWQNSSKTDLVWYLQLFHKNYYYPTETNQIQTSRVLHFFKSLWWFLKKILDILWLFLSETQKKKQTFCLKKNSPIFSLWGCHTARVQLP